MAKISELADGGNLLNDDELIVLRAGGNVRATVANLPEVDASGNQSFADNEKAIFGTGSDLQIYHDGNNSIIKDGGTGDLFLIGSDDVKIQSASGENFARFNENGKVTLYHNNVSKFTTESTGIDVTGTVTADALTVQDAVAGGSVVGNIKNVDNTADSKAVLELQTNNGAWDISANRSGYLDIINPQNTVSARFSSGNPGDFYLFEDTGTTAKFVWDASTERLVLKTSGNHALDVQASANSSATMALFSNNAGSDKAAIRLDSIGAGELVLLDAGNNEDVVITAGGNSYFNGGNVGIGTDSPNEPLTVSGNTLTYGSTGNVGSGVSHFFGNNSNSRDIALTRVASGTLGIGRYSGGWHETARFDTSGNVLVGKSASLLNAVGSQLQATGLVRATTDGSTALQLNRKTSDGAIVEFYKDGGTPVGSINSTGSGSTISIGGGSSGVYMGGAGVYPTNGSGTLADNSRDLGATVYRWKDLYLSGGAYLGGTAAANKLDDYEEGTFTPSFSGGDYTFTYNKQKGSYTKIGNRVFVDMLLYIDSSTAPSGTTDGDLSVTGLPFTFNAQNTVDVLAVSIGFKQQIANAEDSLSVRFQSGNTEFKIHKDLSTGFPDMTLLQASDLTADSRLRIQFSYPTNS